MASDRPVRLALLWHMHQPDYRLHDHVLLPWTRLHAIKDYGEMLRILGRHPEMRCTVNFVPSLLRQVRGYAQEGWTDEVNELLRTPAEDLSEREIDRLHYWATLLPRRQLVDPNPGFAELIDRPMEKSGVWSTPEVRDLQVWYMLSWTGSIAREEAGLNRLIERGSGFSVDEWRRLVRQHDTILDDFFRLLPRHAADSRIEFSTTPYYHPILPLLLDLGSAEEAEKGTKLPDATTGWTEDVEHQLQGSRKSHHDTFGVAPVGCWPSEGSLSTETLDALIRSGFSWTASDQFLLEKTLGEDHGPVEHCFPWRYESDAGGITLFFRDHDLSDRIGFVYSDRDTEESVRDFVERVLEIRDDIIGEKGAEALADAVIPVVLDGENCWEWYPDNGRPFLEALYHALVEHRLIEPVTMTQAALEASSTAERKLDTLEPGSWIGGNFRIWIGGDDRNRAWELLADARDQLMHHRSRVPEEKFLAGWEHILSAEGSDWFWWYSEENNSANDLDFDALFRHRLQEVYRLIELEPPAELDRPLGSLGSMKSDKPKSPSRHSSMHRATFDTGE